MGYNRFINRAMGVAIGVIYIDSFFLYNFFMDVLLLLITAGIAGRKTNWLRVVSSAVLGAMSAVGGILFGNGTIVLVGKMIVIYILVPYLMVRITFGKISGKQTRRTYFILYGVVFCAGGLIQAVALHTMFGYQLMAGYIGNKWLYTSIIIFFAFSFYAVRISNVKSAYSDSLCQVRLRIRGNCYSMMGLIDTGNRLKDPINGKAVNVMNGKIIKDDLNLLYHYIPYHSVGNEHGVIRVFIADDMEIVVNGKKIISEKPEIAVYEGEVSSDLEYDILLNTDLLR